MAEGNDIYRRERLSHGWLDLQRDDNGKWSIRWAPDEGHPDHPGHTYKAGDEQLPDDYPESDDPDALIAWGKKRFGP